jgi:hypothetical protein
MHRATRRGTGRFTLKSCATLLTNIALHYVEHVLVKLKVDTPAAPKNR